MAGNLPVVASGDGVTIDLTAPAGTIVNDGTGDDIVYSGSDSTLSAIWPAFTETVSGISKYEYAIGSSSQYRRRDHQAQYRQWVHQYPLLCRLK